MKAELKIGESAPAFELLDQHGQQVSLKDYAGKKVLVYFYPKASTPGCTTQACSLRDAFADLKDLNVVVLGISPDQPAALKKFAENQNLNFILLSDPEKKTAEAYRVTGEKTMFGKTSIGIIRSSMLIDEKGLILKTWYKVKPADTAPLAIEFLKK
ncbi:MAG: thioredoxin-dependent thiol peroxidase [Candidatus Riflebacteria bacterium]|jgi:peroxiredoxin Q/BCP|nr:thioredoxin-dependent thiol peroxidase [Candidatus Riflebacteria bacterium]